MFERLKARAGRAAQKAVLVAIARLAREADLPADVTVETGEQGLVLIGRRLRRRMLDDARLRKVAR